MDSRIREVEHEIARIEALCECCEGLNDIKNELTLRLIRLRAVANYLRGESSMQVLSCYLDL